MTENHLTPSPVCTPQQISVHALKYFALRALALLLLLSLLWWITAAWIARPATWIAAVALDSTVFLVKQAQPQGSQLNVEAHMLMKMKNPQTGRIETVNTQLTVDAKRFTYSMVLFVALLVAGSRRHVMRRLLGGIALLFFLQAGCVYMDVLSNLVQTDNAAIMQQLNWSDSARRLIHGITYAVNLLISFVAVTLLWAVLDRDYIRNSLLGMRIVESQNAISSPTILPGQNSGEKVETTLNEMAEPPETRRNRV